MRPGLGPRVLVATLYALPVLELVVLITVGQRIGALPVLALVLGSTVLGVGVLRRAGAEAVRDLAAARERMAGGAGGTTTIDPSGRPIGSTRPAADRLLLALAGVLLVVPGLLGSGLGLLLLVPGLRSLVRLGGSRLAERRGGVSGTAQVRVISVEPITPESMEPERAEPERIDAEQTVGDQIDPERVNPER